MICCCLKTKSTNRTIKIPLKNKSFENQPDIIQGRYQRQVKGIGIGLGLGLG